MHRSLLKTLMTTQNNCSRLMFSTHSPKVTNILDNLFLPPIKKQHISLSPSPLSAQDYYSIVQALQLDHRQHNLNSLDISGNDIRIIYGVPRGVARINADSNNMCFINKDNINFPTELSLRNNNLLILPKALLLCPSLKFLTVYGSDFSRLGLKAITHCVGMREQLGLNKLTVRGIKNFRYNELPLDETLLREHYGRSLRLSWSNMKTSLIDHYYEQIISTADSRKKHEAIRSYQAIFALHYNFSTLYDIFSDQPETQSVIVEFAKQYQIPDPQTPVKLDEDFFKQAPPYANLDTFDYEKAFKVTECLNLQLNPLPIDDNRHHDYIPFAIQFSDGLPNRIYHTERDYHLGFAYADHKARRYEHYDDIVDVSWEHGEWAHLQEKYKPLKDDFDQHGLPISHGYYSPTQTMSDKPSANVRPVIK